jgi:hypothetical protein
MALNHPFLQSITNLSQIEAQVLHRPIALFTVFG